MAMTQISKHPFNLETLGPLKSFEKKINWPVVYILENGKQKIAYVGETINTVQRMTEHLANEDRRRMDTFFVIEDDRFNKSATLDIESMLIEHITADGQYELQNSNKGLRNHNYYQKTDYKDIFNDIWQQLKTQKIVYQDLDVIRNSDLFKYSPFKALTPDQYEIADSLIETIRKQNNSISIIRGEPGSGKTILASYLCKYLVTEDPKIQADKIALVLPQTSIRATIGKVFKKIKNLRVGMVIGPNAVVHNEEQYEVLIVDEAHRLTQRRNITSYDAYDAACRKLGLDPQKATQLDWILKKAKHVILLYDEKQRVKPSDIDHNSFEQLAGKAQKFTLTSQMRVLAGDRYSGYIDSVFRGKQIAEEHFDGYDLFLFENIGDMIQRIRKKEQEHSLARLVAGFAWNWVSNNNEKLFDIEIDGINLRWNSTTKDWIYSKNAINEVGCIHTVQGYDLNYTGVIIGPELIYRNGKMVFVRQNYKDKHGNSSTLSDDQMLNYIINIYKTLMTRGIRGTYIYACDEELHEYLKNFFPYAASVYREEAADANYRTPNIGTHRE